MIDVRKAVYTLICLALLIGVYMFWRSEERAKGAAEAAVAVQKARGDSLEGLTKRDQIILTLHDTVRVFRNVTHADTVLQTLIDQHHDTVWVTREVLVEQKATLDSTKKVADACCKLAQDWKARWANSDSLYRYTIRLVPSKAKPWIDRTEGFLACGAVAWVARK